MQSVMIVNLGAVNFARTVLFILTALVISTKVEAQDNYEIQVYGSETVAPGRTMVELHNNFTFTGSKQEIDGVYPTEHAWHETIEITHGWTPWFETGFYIFTSADERYGLAVGRRSYQASGSHSRRVEMARRR